MNGVFLLLGSNLGNSLKFLDQASQFIQSEIGRIIMRSSVYRTKAWGVEEQPDFLNQAVEVASNLSPHEILIKIHDIEKRLGRERRIRWQAREIDIDILYYGELVLNTEELTIPHAQIENRNFALMPMVEIAPDFVHPKLLLTQKELLDRCRDMLDVKKFMPN